METYDVSDVAGMLRKAGNKRKGLGDPNSNQPKILIWWGAGCSVTGKIGTSEQIVKLLKRLHPGHCKSVPAAYMEVMGQLPAGAQKDVISALVRHARLNWAHIALAQLIQLGFVNRVYTTNFDPLIERACNLIGFDQLSVYDLPTTSTDVFQNALIREPALLYLHGRHNGMAQLHTKEATARNPLAKAAISDCRHYAWVVMGYSGENDRLFPEIAQAGLQQYLYWTYRGECKEHVKKILRPERADGGYGVPIDDADEFMIDLARRLSAFPPLLFLKPVMHLSERLKAISHRMPDGARHLLAFSRQTLNSPKDVDPKAAATFSEVFRLFYDNPGEVLSLLRDDAQRRVIEDSREIAELAANACLKAGGLWNRELKARLEELDKYSDGENQCAQDEREKIQASVLEAKAGVQECYQAAQTLNPALTKAYQSRFAPNPILANIPA